MDSKPGNNCDSDNQGHQSDSQKKSSGLTEELKQEFRDILGRGKYAKYKRAYIEKYIEAFITELDSYLPAAKWRLSTEPVNITPGRRHLQNGLTALNNAINQFEQALMVMQPPTTPESAAAYLSHYESTAGLYKSRDMIGKALSPKSGGRPPGIKTHIPESPGDVKNMELPDSLQEVIQNIVYIFWMHLGKPSLYREGPLFKVVGKTLELLNRPLADPYNRIKTAIDFLTSHHPHLSLK